MRLSGATWPSWRAFRSIVCWWQQGMTCPMSYFFIAGVGSTKAGVVPDRPKPKEVSMSQRVVAAIRRSALVLVIAAIGSVTTPRPAAAQMGCVSCWLDLWGGGFDCLTWYVGYEDCFAFGRWCLEGGGICEEIMQLDVAEDGFVYSRDAGSEDARSEIGSLERSRRPADRATSRTCDGILLRARETDAAISRVAAPAFLTL